MTNNQTNTKEIKTPEEINETSGLNDHFTFKNLIKFTLPCIGMMILTSIYSIVDGFFVSNFAGKMHLLP